jgi:hypothetical protein
MFLTYSKANGLSISRGHSMCAIFGNVGDVVAAYKNGQEDDVYCWLKGAKAALEDGDFLAAAGLDDSFQDAIENVHAFLVENSLANRLKLVNGDHQDNLFINQGIRSGVIGKKCRANSDIRSTLGFVIDYEHPEFKLAFHKIKDFIKQNKNKEVTFFVG